MHVRIYWNLHKACWSVQDYATRRVIGHATQVMVRDALFRVYDSGRERVLAEGKKNVHAFVVGELVGALWCGVADAITASGYHWTPDCKALRLTANAEGQGVTYNPRRFETFVTVADELPIHTAKAVYLTWEHRQGSSDLTPKSRVMAFEPVAEPVAA